MSAINMVKDTYGTSFTIDLENNLKTSNFSGSDVLGYMRELRNGVVHRGIDLSASSTVIDGIICAVAPRTVKDRNDKFSYLAPATLLRDIFIHCEISAKRIIERFLEPGFEELLLTTPDTMLSDTLKAIEASPYIPEWVKEMASKRIEPEMLVNVRAHQIEKLRRLLKPRTGRRIA
jgi:hypothetical protein